MSKQAGLLPVFGAAGIARSSGGEFSTDEGISHALSILKSHSITHIDTAQLYSEGNSEASLGRLEAAKSFTIDTKWISGWRGSAWASGDKIISSAAESLERLQTDQVDVFYLHCPDIHTDFAETLKGVNDVYEKGSFKRFGLSNFDVQQTKEVMEICEREGYVKPTVYQLSYSPVARRAEEELIPLLRGHGMALYAYSPISGGFLTKSRSFIASQQGRFTKDGIYGKMYRSEVFMSLLEKWEAIADGEGVSKAELAYRWVNHHSALKPENGDALIFGASSGEQLEQTCGYMEKGPLSEKAVEGINELWPSVRGESILDNFQATFGS